jgi:hypothetical protein
MEYFHNHDFDSDIKNLNISLEMTSLLKIFSSFTFGYLGLRYHKKCVFTLFAADVIFDIGLR